MFSDVRRENQYKTGDIYIHILQLFSAEISFYQQPYILAFLLIFLSFLTICSMLVTEKMEQRKSLKLESDWLRPHEQG